MVRFHGALSEESVYFRYAGALKLAQRVAHDRLARRCDVDPAREVALVAELAGPDGAPEIGGVGRLTRMDGDEAELGLLVLDRYQHHGLGTELLTRLLEAGRARGIRRITAEILRANGAMQHLCQKLGFEIAGDGDFADPMVRAVRDLGPPAGDVTASPPPRCSPA